MISYNDFKNKIEELGYYAEDELLYDAYNALCLFNDSIINPGQDIFAICLEGPPGAGKTEFAKVYCKLANSVFNGNVFLVDYQCDATTGKSELFEDINISAAIRRDADNVNIPGKLIEAINKVNDGKRVVLFIDEYDKAREETDAFLLQFLQSGKINSTQHGDLSIKEKYKGNLQVILCKNDMREELSGPLSRRIRIIRLDYMRPEIFYKAASRVLLDNKKNANLSILNLVALIYESVYNSKELYKRLPSCSEMLIAIEDANRLLIRANAPQHIVYKILIKNLFKSQDDVNTFESKIHTSTNEDEKKLASLIDGMRSSETPYTKEELSQLISDKLFAEQSSEWSEKTAELKNLIEEYKTKFANMEIERKKAIDAEIERILLENGKLVLSDEHVEAVTNFNDETAYVKRGVSIFNGGNDWVNIGVLKMPDLSHEELINKAITYAANLDIKIYENGIEILNKDGERIILIKDVNGEYCFMANIPVISSTSLNDISNFIKFATQVLVNQYRKTAITDYGEYNIETLIYNDDELNLTKVENQIFAFNNSGSITPEMNELQSLIAGFKCNDHANVVNASKEIMNNKGKVLKHE